VKKIFIILLSIITSCALFTYLIYFEGEKENISKWWLKFAATSTSLPYSPYKHRRENASDLEVYDANHIEFSDAHLFWKGFGAIAVPVLDEEGYIEKIHVVSEGSGYSNLVTAKVVGCNADKFLLGPLITDRGSVKELGFLKSYKWSHSPRSFIQGEDLPFSGTVETKFPSGQIIEEVPYLNGLVHGKVIRFNEYGIPRYSKEYAKGEKHGTHIYWFPDPLDPENYQPVNSPEGGKFMTLWSKVRYLAAKKFGENFGSHRSNKWMVEKYRLSGGDFRVRLLEHWSKNLKHGLFEGFDEFGNKTFKDEYTMGRRTKHKTFDKTKG